LAAQKEILASPQKNRLDWAKKQARERMTGELIL